jgi:hypothetical protein
MKIHGVRIYRSGFLNVFRATTAAWHDCIFANDFGVTINANGAVEDPLPGLRRTYGSALLAVDVQRRLVLIRGSEFDRWGAAMAFCEGALLPVLHEATPFETLRRLYWDRTFRLTSDTWPVQMRALLHMWDGVFWQLFTTEESDVDTLVRAHSSDPKVKMFFVDLDREYPDPSNAELMAANLPGITGDA